jgi:transcriptional pleiotropic regulator of transition state genes
MIKVLRKVDELGRIVIPIDVRKQLGIKEGETLEISIENNKIVLEKKYA